MSFRISRTTALLLASLALLAAPGPAPAATLTYPVDRVHSGVEFKIRHLVSRVVGRFTDFQGEVRVDPENVAATLRIDGTVAVSSVDTANEKRDNHLRSDDFFAAETYPQLTFKTKSVKAAGERYLVTGDLTMRGVTKEVTLDTEIIGFMASSMSGTPSVGLEATGTVDRKDFGISWNRNLDTGGFVLGDTVEITIRIEATVPREG